MTSRLSVKLCTRTSEVTRMKHIFEFVFLCVEALLLVP